MLVYDITLWNYKTDTQHTREIFVDSKTKEEAERRIKRTFDNLVKYRYKRKGELPHQTFIFEERNKYNIKPENDNVTKATRRGLRADVLNYLKDKNETTAKEISLRFDIRAQNVYGIINVEFKYDKSKRCYVRFKPHIN